MLAQAGANLISFCAKKLTFQCHAWSACCIPKDPCFLFYSFRNWSIRRCLCQRFTLTRPSMIGTCVCPCRITFARQLTFGSTELERMSVARQGLWLLFQKPQKVKNVHEIPCLSHNFLIVGIRMIIMEIRYSWCWSRIKIEANICRLHKQRICSRMSCVTMTDEWGMESNSRV